MTIIWGQGVWDIAKIQVSIKCFAKNRLLLQSPSVVSTERVSETLDQAYEISAEPFFVSMLTNDGLNNIVIAFYFVRGVIRIAF